eukprot:CAMPEP_0171109946 /NCGR_PEP_ID=MMETSP0766_2-20121228/71073_1 /TAXON_ID=439317 /ORGANISM="Gambierdiscus australes, Strain CAWD 149" /LENGTH=95 /DNA_ID=CAMNT_0011571751 /DNA_START=51 /DNA_END=338 /DNA_ORIENTATION=-
MAQRSSSRLAALALCLCACWLLASAPAFLSAPGATSGQLPARAAALAAVAVAAAPQAALAASSYYALVQLGWSVFIIGLGPAVLFWIYFNKPEIL